MKTKRSNTYRKIFDDDCMIEVFGKLEPSTPERTARFFELWCEWRPNRIKLKPKTQPYVIKKQLDQLGMKDLFDFQVRSDEIRFKNKEDYALAILSGLRPYIKEYELINV